MPLMLIRGGREEGMETRAGEIRAFIAVELPEAVKEYLSTLSDELKRARGDVKWVRPESIHLTLKFLGTVRLELVPALEAAAAPVFSREQSFGLRAGGLGAFPNLGRPRVIWAGLEDRSGSLGPLAASVESAVEPLGFPREKRSFNPHLTLGRVRSDAGKRDLAEAVRHRMDSVGPSFTVDHAALFQSILKPTGAEYRVVRRFDFSPGAVDENRND